MLKKSCGHQSRQWREAIRRSYRGRSEETPSGAREAVVNLETLKGPSRGEAEKHESYRRPEQHDGCDQQFAAGRRAANQIYREIDDPPHDPRGGSENPKAEYPAAPVDGRFFIPAEWAALHGG